MSRSDAPRPGDRAPAFRGATPEGAAYDLAKAAAPVLIEFHRGTW